jgi:hypothetical protein
MSESKFETWALVELFGHQKIAGMVSEAEIGGAKFIRVDVPKADGSTDYTRFYGPAAIYAISPTDRQIAIGLAANIQARPVTIYDVAKLGAHSPVGALDEGGDDHGC